MTKNRIIKRFLLIASLTVVFASIVAFLTYEEFPIGPFLISTAIILVAMAMGLIIRLKHRNNIRFQQKAMPITLILLAISLIIDGVIITIEGARPYDYTFIAVGVPILIYYYIKNKNRKADEKIKM